jgi:hypothetical protein
MSGIKCTQALLNRLAELLLQTKGEKKNITEKIKALALQADDLSNKLDMSYAKEVAIRDRLKEYGEVLKQESQNIKNREKQIQNISIPDTIKNTSPDFLEKLKEGLFNIKNKNKETVDTFDRIDLDIINLNTADKSLSKIEFGQQKFINMLKAQEDLLKKWVPEEYQSLNQGYEDCKRDFSHYKGEAAKQKNTEAITRTFKNIEETLQKLNLKLESLTQEAGHREELHQKRLYILTGLREVCQSLGFEEISEPIYEKKGDFNSPVVHIVDTLNEGRVTFKLHLDNHIESDSGIRLGTCQDEFGKLSELLKQTYGVQTVFKRVAQEEEPKRISKTERPIPREGRKAIGD